MWGGQIQLVRIKAHSFQMLMSQSETAVDLIKKQNPELLRKPLSPFPRPPPFLLCSESWPSQSMSVVSLPAVSESLAKLAVDDSAG